MKRVNKDIDYAILKALKSEANYISGEELAHKLQISRQGLWKHIANLTAKGYDIVAVPHLGYRLILSPDKFYPWEVKYKLGTRFIAQEIYYHQIVDSTQDLVWKLGLEGASEGVVVFSEVQKKARGRLKRKWISPRGGIYFSLLLRPKFLLLQEIPQISLLVALSCLKGIKKVTGIECWLKWPNDIFLEGKKIGGVLCEINAEIDRIHFVVVGVGLNINSKDLPREATSLLLNTKKKFSRLEIVKEVFRELELSYQEVEKKGFTSLLKEWSQFCPLWGKRLRVKIADKTLEGEAIRIDEKGYLLLRQDNGFLEKVSAADTLKVIVN